MKSMKYFIIATVLATALGSVGVYAMDQEQEHKEAAAAQAFTSEQVEQANRDLWYAILRDNVDDVIQALMGGAHINQPGRDGYTPLTLACTRRYSPIVVLLLNHGARINQPNRSGLTPLLEACRRGNTALVELLLDRGADVNHQPDQYGFTSLRQACRTGNNALVKLLLDRGADVNQPNQYGDTPLTAGCDFGGAGMVKRLVFHGATLSGPGSAGIRAIAGVREVIAQAQAARRQVGDYCLNLGDINVLGARTPLPINLVSEVYRFTHPLVGVQDPELRELIKDQIIKNRERLLVQEGAVAEQEKRADEENDYKSVGFYMGNLLERHKLSQAQISALNDLLTYGSNGKGELNAEAAHAIIANYLEQLADNVAQQGEAERKDNAQKKR